MDMDKVTYDTILDSLDVMKNKAKVFQAGEGAGASGSFFFFSYDNKFILKTMRQDEKKNFLQIIDKYIAHIAEMGNKSMMARVYGIFSIDTAMFRPIDIIIMQNTTKFFNKKNVMYRFDLKGSFYKRWTKYNLSKF